MAANDTILLDGLIERRMAETGTGDRGKTLNGSRLSSSLRTMTSQLTRSTRGGSMAAATAVSMASMSL